MQGREGEKAVFVMNFFPHSFSIRFFSFISSLILFRFFSYSSTSNIETRTSRTPSIHQVNPSIQPQFSHPSRPSLIFFKAHLEFFTFNLFSMKYDTVPSEILLESFKKLDCKERVRARLVCKEWLNIIDENRSLWRSLECSVEMDDGAEPKALVLFDEKSQSSLKDVSVYAKVAGRPREDQERSLDRLFNTLVKSNMTLKSVILKIESGYEFKRPSKVLLNCPNLDTFMLVDPRYFRSKVAILEDKGGREESREGSKLRLLWTSLPSSLVSDCPRILGNLVSFAVRWELPASEWREVLQASARSLKHLQIEIKDIKGDSAIISTLKFPNLKVLEVDFKDKFPEWMVFPSTTILILWFCGVQENLPLVNELWLSSLIDGFKLRKCCPSLRELRISGQLGDWHRRAVLDLLHEREKQVAIGFEVAGVRMVPLKRIVLSFKSDKCGFLDKVRELVEQVVNLEEVPDKIPVYI